MKQSSAFLTWYTSHFYHIKHHFSACKTHIFSRSFLIKFGDYLLRRFVIFTPSVKFASFVPSYASIDQDILCKKGHTFNNQLNVTPGITSGTKDPGCRPLLQSLCSPSSRVYFRRSVVVSTVSYNETGPKFDSPP